MSSVETWYREALQSMQGGDAVAALSSLGRILEVDPHHHGALFLSGSLTLDEGDAEAALPLLRRAAQAQAGHGLTQLALARALRLAGHLPEARQAAEAALKLGVPGGSAHCEMGNVVLAEDNLAEAGRWFGKAAMLRPGFVEAEDFYLFCCLYDESVSLPELRARSERWGRSLMARSAWMAPPGYPNPPDPGRPLRIGYISGDFRRHAVSYFLAPIFAAADPAALEVTVYANVPAEDEITRAQRSLVPRWRDIRGVPDPQVAMQIYQDGIDILVDLAGHTVDNRLRVMALRPAPIQVTYLGHPTTTGLPTVDYRITSRVLDPAGTEALYTERCAYLEGGFCCYTPPPEEMLAVGPLPALANGHVTFGSVMNPRKITPRVVGVWARALNAVPGSRLRLFRYALGRPEVRERLAAAFAEHGVARGRIDFGGEEGSRWEDVLAFYNTVDLSMDSFRYNGHTTTCESLWMGVPVVALAGDAYISRVGMALYDMLGMPEMVADSEDAFVRLAVSLATDTGRLAELRAGLRGRMRASRLLDAQAFGKALENCYRSMWREWCAGRPNPAG
ncbi:MAG: hypothetical protein OEW11_08970 [Nitrospirota bacterium]|nr:hypothetical protein [Nitrospirota bacterium]